MRVCVCVRIKTFMTATTSRVKGVCLSLPYENISGCGIEDTVSQLKTVLLYWSLGGKENLNFRVSS